MLTANELAARRARKQLNLPRSWSVFQQDLWSRPDMSRPQHRQQAAKKWHFNKFTASSWDICLELTSDSLCSLSVGKRKRERKNVNMTTIVHNFVPSRVQLDLVNWVLFCSNMPITPYKRYISFVCVRPISIYLVP